MVKSKTEDAHGTSNAMFALRRAGSAIHNAQKPFGTDKFSELFSLGLKMSKDAGLRANQMEPMLPSLHLQTTLDSLLFL